MPRGPVLFAVVLATVSASTLFSTTTSVATASEVELCFGQVPTIVGAEDQSLVGTDGPDVVIVQGGDVRTGMATISYASSGYLMTRPTRDTSIPEAVAIASTPP
jgi:hypothetical protein